MSALFLWGCTQTPPLQNAAGTRVVPAEQAFAFPPPGGPAVTGVLERRFANGTQQDILLATSARTPGQNMLRIQLFGPVDTQLATNNHLRPGYLPVTNVASEMRQLFPGVRMQQSPYYVQNKYGAFGYAAGRSPSGDTCLYGWQRITSTGSTQTWIGNKGSFQIRLRLCEQGTLEPRLLETMYGFTITSYIGSGNWNPYGEPAGPPGTLGSGGHPIYPVGGQGFQTVTAVPSPPPPVRRSRNIGPAATSPEPPALPAPVGPTVPPPPGSVPGSVPEQSGGGVPAVSPATAIIVPPPPCTTPASCAARD